MLYARYKDSKTMSSTTCSDLQTTRSLKLIGNVVFQQIAWSFYESLEKWTTLIVKEKWQK